MKLKQNRILMITFVESEFGGIEGYEFQTKEDFYEDIF